MVVDGAETGINQSPGEGAGAAGRGRDSGAPGPPPGVARSDCRNGRITLGNAALSVSWRHTPQGLKGLGFRDATAHREWPLTGEIFEIVLADGRRYPASALAPEGDPRQGELAPDPNAARLAGRIAPRPPLANLDLPIALAANRIGESLFLPESTASRRMTSACNAHAGPLRLFPHTPAIPTANNPPLQPPPPMKGQPHPLPPNLRSAQ